jgi:hypothetical protein
MSSITSDKTPVPTGMPRGKRPAPPPPLKTKSSMSWVSWGTRIQLTAGRAAQTHAELAAAHADAGGLEAARE